MLLRGIAFGVVLSSIFWIGLLWIMDILSSRTSLIVAACAVTVFVLLCLLTRPADDPLDDASQRIDDTVNELSPDETDRTDS